MTRHASQMLSAPRRPDSSTATPGGRAGTAVLVEALIILLFLVASLGLLMQVLARASITGEHAAQLTLAIELASDAAERFAADPLGEPEPLQDEDLLVNCKVTNSVASDAAAGQLLQAHIVVVDTDGNEVYALDTARYVSAAGAMPTDAAASDGGEH